MKQPADNHLQPEAPTPKQVDVIDTSEYGYVYGTLAGIVVTPAVLEKARKAEEEFQSRQEEKKRRPPRPPRPNARIGGIALGNT